jgi:cytochrome c oxidase subunit 1
VSTTIEQATPSHADEHKPRGITRWLCSTNHKDIGTMYLIFSIVFGIVGALFSVLFRMELAAPGTQVMPWLSFLGEPNQVFNVLITGHGVIMVFFMVMPALIGGSASATGSCR